MVAANESLNYCGIRLLFVPIIHANSLTVTANRPLATAAYTIRIHAVCNVTLKLQPANLRQFM